MKKIVYLSLILFQLICFTACSSVDGDAKKAAKLNMESIEYVKQQNLDKAQETYNESQEIVNRYKATDQYEEFYAAYSKYLLEEMSASQK